MQNRSRIDSSSADAAAVNQDTRQVGLIWRVMPASLVGLFNLLVFSGLALLARVTVAGLPTTSISSRRSTALGDSFPVVREVFRLQTQQQIIIGLLAVIAVAVVALSWAVVSLLAVHEADRAWAGFDRDHQLPRKRPLIGAIESIKQVMPAAFKLWLPSVVYLIVLLVFARAAVMLVQQLASSSLPLALLAAGVAAAVGWIVASRLTLMPLQAVAIDTAGQLGRRESIWAVLRTKSIASAWSVACEFLIQAGILVVICALISGIFFGLIGPLDGVNDLRGITLLPLWVGLMALVWLLLRALLMPSLLRVFRR